MNHPELNTTFKYYDMSRTERMEMWWERVNTFASIDKKRYFDECEHEDHGAWEYLHISASPLTVHNSMFYWSVEFLANEQQRETWLPRIKALNYLGCYA